MSRVPDPIDVHVGARLRYRRMLVGMSQEALGGILGLTFQQIQKYEKGQNRIGASRLHRIAQALGVPVGFFFEGIADAAAQSATGVVENANPMAFIASAEGLQLNLAFQRVEDPATRRKIVDLVETLARAASA